MLLFSLTMIFQTTQRAKIIMADSCFFHYRLSERSLLIVFPCTTDRFEVKNILLFQLVAIFFSQRWRGVTIERKRSSPLSVFRSFCLVLLASSRSWGECWYDCLSCAMRWKASFAGQNGSFLLPHSGSWQREKREAFPLLNKKTLFFKTYSFSTFFLCVADAIFWPKKGKQRCSKTFYRTPHKRTTFF